MIRRERSSWRFVVGVILVTIFALLCVVPLVYMVLVSFADTTTMYIRWETSASSIFSTTATSLKTATSPAPSSTA